MSQEDIISQLEWFKDPTSDSEFENWWDTRSLPAAYNFIEPTDGFKTKEAIEDPKDGGKWKYGVRKYYNKKLKRELLKVWRVPWKDYGGGGGGGNTKWPKKANYRCIDFELAEPEDARTFLKTNTDSTSDRYYEARNPIVVRTEIPGPVTADGTKSLGNMVQDKVLIPLYLMKRID